MNIPAHLDPAHGPVAQRADGRWFITMGHPGFNCRVNNSLGFVDAEAALQTIRALRRVAATRAAIAAEAGK